MAALKLFLVLIGLLLISHVLLLPTSSAYDDDDDRSEFEWKILTSNNFSSQIHLHPHLLVLLTVPWCGESRSLMREMSTKLANDQPKYSSLKLRVLHRNRDKALGDSLDSGEGITVLCYRHGMSYKYQGRLRAEDILFSIDYLISLAPEELPLKRINDAEELQTFLSSTDKAVLLHESCGWTSKLVAQHYGNASLQGGVISRGLDKEINSSLASRRQRNLKDMTNDMMNREVEDGCGGSPWVGEFSAENGTSSSTDEDVQPTFLTSCSFEEYKNFESFFLKFMAFSRAHYLPPQRQKYGIVSEGLLLSPLGVEVSGGWLLIVSYAGCLGCLRSLKDAYHLQDTLEMHDLPVLELENKMNDLGPDLPIDKPSVLLFVDRTSYSTESKRKSQEALHAFRQVAMQHWKPYQDGRKIDWPKSSSFLKYQVSTSKFGNHKLLLSSSQKIMLKDKMSIMIINEGKHITLDNEALNLPSGSLHEIMTYLLRQKKPPKLNSLAREAGFQLLSDDIDIKIADVLLSQTENQNQDSVEKSVGVSDEDFLDVNADETDKASALVEHEEQSGATKIEAVYIGSERKSSNDIATKESAFVDPSQSLNSHGLATVVGVDPTARTNLEDDSEGLNHHFSGFSGSFFFFDGNHQFLESLTSDSEVPRVVIVDPISQQHYVLPEVENLAFSSIADFIDGFINGTLLPYQRSGPLQKSIKMPQPPFVSLDFHEKDSVPCVTTDTFSELVLGSGESDVQNETNALHRDVLVLFSSRWCGFCQRMDVVVREVHRALKGFVEMVRCEPTSNQSIPKDYLKDDITKLPAIYSIDCTLNECGGILKSVSQREVYPTLLLFPAKRKAAIPYSGNMMVTDIIKFVANHGSSSYHLAKQKGTLWNDDQNREEHERENQGNKFTDPFTVEGNEESANGKDEQYEALSKDGKLENQVNSKQSEKADPPNVDVGSFIVATQYVHGLNPFNEARILIIGADRSMGFQGLIVNKHIRWDSLPDFKHAKILKEAPLSFGGPVVHEEMPLVSLTKSSLNGQYLQVLPGVHFLDQLATMNAIEQVEAGSCSAIDYWFFWGYSGWTWDQLFGEIAGGTWSLDQRTLEDLQWP